MHSQVTSAVETARFLFEKYRHMLFEPDLSKYEAGRRKPKRGLPIEIETAREVVKLLKSRKTSYSEIAQAAGCSVSSVGLIARGKHKICSRLQEAAQ